MLVMATVTVGDGVGGGGLVLVMATVAVVDGLGGGSGCGVGEGIGGSGW